MLKYEETNASVVQHEGEQSSEVAVNNATVFVHKCSKTEDICNQFVIIIPNQVGACCHAICRTGIDRYL